MTRLSKGDLVFLHAYPYNVAKKAGIGSITGMPEKQDLVNGIARVREHYVNGTNPDLNYVSIFMPDQEEHYGDAAGHCAWPPDYVELVATADEARGMRPFSRAVVFAQRIKDLILRAYVVSWP